jgi:large subunit ribosomal protein L9
MEIILLEKIKKLGNVGDLVNVKDGYARNYLFIKEKALRATEENKEKFRTQKKLIEKADAEKKVIASKNLKKIDGKTFSIIRQSGDDGRLYGSVTNKDIATILFKDFGIDVAIEHIILEDKIKDIGLHNVVVELHAEVEAKIRIIIARSEEEAKNELEKEKKAEPTKKTNKE